SKVAARMRAAELSGRTVALRVRYTDFTTISRSRTLPGLTDITAEIYATAVDLFTALKRRQQRLRLVGVRVEGLVPTTGTSRQLALGERIPGWQEADKAIDQAVARFGREAVRPATLVTTSRP